jgi:hypothetical protein
LIIISVGGVRSACKVVNGKPEMGISLKRYKSRWEDNIKMDLKTVSENLDCIILVPDIDIWLILVNALL